MHPPIDLAKLVGAASAPVALIIATCILFGNLTAKYSSIFASERALLKEYRDRPTEDDEKNEPRENAIKEQTQMMAARLLIIMRATYWLNIAIWCFIGTVLMTSIAVIFPNVTFLAVITGLFMFVGLILLAVSVAAEAKENNLAKKILFMELSEFPEIKERAEEFEAKGRYVHVAAR